MNITKGKIAKAQKVVVYGPEGIGKSTFAAQFPNPLFIDTEGSTNNMEVARLDKPSSWTMILQQIDFIKLNKPCQTVVIDTIDWAERLGIDFVCSRGDKTSITKFGYGEGYIQLEEEFGKFLNRLSDLIEVGINVVLTAHAKITKFEQPDELGAYDRYELKLGNKTTAKTASLVKEWADMVLFCNYKTMSVATDDKGTKFKGQGGKRVIYTTHHPAWDAKNRFGLPEEMDMNYSLIAGIFQSVKATNEPVGEFKPVEETVIDTTSSTELTPDVQPESNDLTGIPVALADLMKQNNVIPIEIQTVVGNKGYYPADTPISNYDAGFIDSVLVGAWQQVFGQIQEARKNQSF